MTSRRDASRDADRGAIARRPLTSFFALAYGVSWIVWAPLWLGALGVSGLPTVPYHHALGAVGPIAAALIVSARLGDGRGVRELVRGMVAWRGRVPWIAVAVLGPVVLLLIAAGAASLVAGTSIPLARLGQSAEFPEFGLAAFLLYNVVTFGYGEEVGWRGFALPRLQAERSALSATLLLTVGWAGWHAPLFLYRAGYAEMGLAGAAGWLVSLATGAILLTWLYNGSRGSLLVVALFHAAVDVVFTSRISSELVMNATGALITVSALAVLAITGPRFLSRGGKMVADEDGTTRFERRDVA